jgi:heme exporter protein A
LSGGASAPPFAIAAHGLAKRFGPVVALAVVDFAVPPGRVLGVLGPNGAGKSTLLRILAGLTRPTTGRVSMGTDAARAGDRRYGRGRVGYVGHATFLYPSLSARENLVFAARLYGVPDPQARAAALLAEQRLESIAERAAGSVSRGQAQRLAIARGRVHDPPVVLLDEPFTGLDPTSADRLAAHLRTLAASGRAVVLVTHDLAQAASVGDRALLLVRGRIAFDSGATRADVASLELAWREATAA